MSGGTYAPYFPLRQHGLKQISGVKRPAGNSTGTDDCMNFINKQDTFLQFFNF